MNALALWCGMHLLLMLLLALNVSRLRIKSMRAPVEPSVLEGAVRAHGNNIEYVPAALLGLLVLVLLGVSDVWVHGLGGSLFIARMLHAIGIQQRTSAGPPPARIAGNLLTWAVFAVIGVTLIMRALR